MTANSQMQIRLHKALPEAAPDGPRIMPVIAPAEAVCIELPDGTTFSGVVTSESAEIDNQVRVVTKTIRVRPEGSMTPRIIRTRDELIALDPDTMLVSTFDTGCTFAAKEPQEMLARGGWVGIGWIPAVVIDTEDQFRDARQALGDA